MPLHKIGARGDTKCQNHNSFFLRGEYIENKTFLLNLPDIKVFFRIERILSKPFLKKTISIHSMHLHHLGDVLDKERARFNPASVPETYTGNDISKFTLIILYA